MGRKGSWSAAIKRVFVPSSKDKSTDGKEKNTTKEKKKGRGILRAGDSKSFIPLFREPSSIEKILGEVDEEKLFRPPIPSEQQKASTLLLNRPTSPRIVSPTVATCPEAASSSMPSQPRVASPRVSPPRTTYQKVPSPKLASPRGSSPRPTYQKVAPPKASSPTVSPPRPTDQKVAPPKAASPTVSSPRPIYQKLAPSKAASPKAASPRITHNRKEVSYRPEPTSRDVQMSAIRIQTAFRGYSARRTFRALRGLVRLQGVVTGQNVKWQTKNAMKQMQLLVKVQTQFHSRRTQMLENQGLQCQSYRNDREMESTMSKWTYNQLVDGNNKEWDNSMLTKEEREERLRKRAEAVIKRQRAMSYAYYNQFCKPQPKSAGAALGGFHWWGNWLEHHRPPSNASGRQTPVTNIQLAPQRPISEQKLSPLLQTSSYNHHSYMNENDGQITPTSSKSSMPVRGRQLLHTPGRTPPSNGSSSTKYLRPRAGATNSRFGGALRDDDSVTSCPPFSVPNYMQPTVSAKAKVRANSNPNERILRTLGNESKRRFSFLSIPNISPFKWNKGSNKDSSSPRVMGEKQSVQSTDDHLSMDSAVSMPAVVGRRPFNRFV